MPPKNISFAPPPSAPPVVHITNGKIKALEYAAEHGPTVGSSEPALSAITTDQNDIARDVPHTPTRRQPTNLNDATIDEQNDMVRTTPYTPTRRQPTTLEESIDEQQGELIDEEDEQEAFARTSTKPGEPSSLMRDVQTPSSDPLFSSTLNEDTQHYKVPDENQPLNDIPPTSSPSKTHLSKNEGFSGFANGKQPILMMNDGLDEDGKGKQVVRTAGAPRNILPSDIRPRSSNEESLSQVTHRDQPVNVAEKTDAKRRKEFPTSVSPGSALRPLNKGLMGWVETEESILGYSKWVNGTEVRLFPSPPPMNIVELAKRCGSQVWPHRHLHDIGVSSPNCCVGIIRYSINFKDMTQTLHHLPYSMIPRDHTIKTHGLEPSRMVLPISKIDTVWDKEALITAIKSYHRREMKRKHFLAACILAGVIEYTVHVEARQIVYVGRKGESYLEEFQKPFPGPSLAVKTKVDNTEASEAVAPKKDDSLPKKMVSAIVSKLRKLNFSDPPAYEQ